MNRIDESKTQVKFKVAPLPVSNFDVLDEVDRNPERYRGKNGETKSVSLYDAPTYLKMNLRFVLDAAVPRAETGAVISALIWCGYRCLLPEDCPTQRYLEACMKADKSRLLADDRVELERWRQSPDFKVSDEPLSGLIKRWSFRWPEPIKKAVFGLSGRLGMSGSRLALLCLVDGLSQQENHVVPEHAEYMAADVVKFDRMMDQRARRIEALLEVFKRQADMGPGK